MYDEKMLMFQDVEIWSEFCDYMKSLGIMYDLMEDRNGFPVAENKLSQIKLDSSFDDFGHVLTDKVFFYRGDVVSERTFYEDVLSGMIEEAYEFLEREIC